MATALPAGYSLRFATTNEDFAAFARLACAYHAWLNVDLCFQNFEQELASLPGTYDSPAGCILLVSFAAGDIQSSSNACQRQDVACVAVRPLKQCHSQGSCSRLAEQQCDSQISQQQCNDEHAHRLSSDKEMTMHDKNTCELKRLWVDEQHQQKGLGKALVIAAFEAAKQMGYRTMVLDTLERLIGANKLYEKLGFVKRTSYYHNPLPGKLYLMIDTRATPLVADSKALT